MLPTSSRLLASLAVASFAAARTITYDFDIGWVKANPDGAFERQVIGINGQWPIPRIEGNVGDRIIVNVNNSLGDEDTSLHFHGLFMNGTAHMDGPVQVSQCPIPPGSSFTYNFTLDQPGTYWYHSHNKGQYPDGLRGPLIIHDPQDPHRDSYDEELILTVSDWYHDRMPGLIKKFMDKTNPTGAEPVPNAALMNETQNFKLPVKPNTTYLFRVINIGAFAGQHVWFEGHKMRIVEVDGVYTEAAEADLIYLSAAQRCSFLVTTKNETNENFAFVASMDTTLFDQLPEDLQYNVTGWLTYDESAAFPEPAIIEGEFQPFDDMTLVPWDKQERLPEPDQTFHLNVIMDNLGDGANYAFFNNISYAHPTVPTLYTVLTSGTQATDPTVYGDFTHSMVLEKNEVVQIVVDNLDPGRHPFHLHGHNFQALHRSAEEAGPFADTGVSENDYPAIPMRRDTFVLFPNGNIVLRFKADNAGVWLFHCHIEWHVVSGLMATFVEAPLELQETIELPEDHLNVCRVGNVPVAGNAAGNTANLLDLAGEPRPPKPLPAGFTPRGIVALVFSCICGILGVIVVAWYGYVDVPDKPDDGSEDKVAAGSETLFVPESSKGLDGVTIAPAQSLGTQPSH